MSHPDFNKILIECSKLPLDDVMGSVSEKDFSDFLCYYWAYIFNSIYGGQLYSIKIKKNKDTVENFNNIYEHAFVNLNGKYYDSRHLSGVSLISEFFQESSNFNLTDYSLIEYESSDQFLYDWDVHHEKNNYDKTIKKIKKIIV